MGCEVVDVGGATAIVCSRGRQRPRCQSCKVRAASIQCDYPVIRDGRETTCDRWCCERCRERVGPDRDYCLPHARYDATKGGRARWIEG